jgi:hypothetical protein
MKDRAPIFSCTPQTERQEVDWISYNPKVGQKELQPICDKQTFDSPELDALLKKGDVFGVAYPAD